MEKLKVSLRKIHYREMNETRINPFWFTSDYSIHLSTKRQLSVELNREKLSERSFLELKAAQKLGLVDVEVVTA